MTGSWARRGAALAAVLAVALGLAVATPANASEQRPTLEELEGEVMCPTCKSLLELSHSPAADRIRALIVDRIEAGDTKSEIKEVLVADFGEEILAAPRKSGVNLLAWLLPLVGLLAALIVVAVVLRRWRASRASTMPAGATTATLDPGLEGRIDDELARYDD